MDNLTHTLIGILAGETAARTSSEDPHGLPPQTRRNLLVTLAAIGSNLPDADLLYSFIGGKINYLTHHRGHTHTIVGALLLAALAYAATHWWLRKRGLDVSRKDRRWIIGTVLLAPLLHIAMDATNNYGVHPFWPWHNGWFYGDSVFIIEPLLWTACAPLVFLLRTPTARVLVALCLAAGVALAFFSGLLPPLILAAYLFLLAGMLALGRTTPARTALLCGVSLWLGVTATFMMASQVAAGRAHELAAQYFPQSRLLDHILTPMPANPLCWELILVGTQHDELALRRAMLSLVPSWMPAQACRGRSLDALTTAPLVPVRAAATDGLRWHGEVLTPRHRLVELDATDCRAAAALRFMRAPWLASVEGQTILGDLRYDREPALGFAEIDLDERSGCPIRTPDWLPPRKDLLEPEVDVGGHRPHPPS